MFGNKMLSRTNGDLNSQRTWKGDLCVLTPSRNYVFCLSPLSFKAAKSIVATKTNIEGIRYGCQTPVFRWTVNQNRLLLLQLDCIG